MPASAESRVTVRAAASTAEVIDARGLARGRELRRRGDAALAAQVPGADQGKRRSGRRRPACAGSRRSRSRAARRARARRRPACPARLRSRARARRPASRWSAAPRRGGSPRAPTPMPRARSSRYFIRTTRSSVVPITSTRRSAVASGGLVRRGARRARRRGRAGDADVSTPIDVPPINERRSPHSARSTRTSVSVWIEIQSQSQR